MNSTNNNNNYNTSSPRKSMLDQAGNSSINSLDLPAEAFDCSCEFEMRNGGPDGKRVDYDDLEESPLGQVRAQSRALSKMKAIVLVILLCSGVLLALGAYLTQKNRNEDDDGSETAWISSVVVAVVYVMQILLFLRYDSMVSHRHACLLEVTQQSRKIVNSLFPSNIRDRLMKHTDTTDRRGSMSSYNREDDNNNLYPSIKLKSNNNSAESLDNVEQAQPTAPKSDHVLSSPVKVVAKKARKLLSVMNDPPGTTLRMFLSSQGEHNNNNNNNNNNTNNNNQSKLPNAETTTADFTDEPIADYFKNVTVLFLDISGFTAWSAVRDPPQVFRLLETLYSAFDDLASKLKVFKVETIGDSYMAVTGLPEPSKHHAINMVRFAHQCVRKMDMITDMLEAELGPGTKDLGCRVGLHSGPVTAGVLRGQKSRFQLFGDTVNTASRMETTGIKGKIQVSKETADLLFAAGKSHWIKPREQKIVAKGKGELLTYWVEPRRKAFEKEPSIHQSKLQEMMEESSNNTLVSLATDANSLMEESHTSLGFSDNDSCTEQSYVIPYSGGGAGNVVVVDMANNKPKSTRQLPRRRMPEKLSMTTASTRHLRLESETRDGLEEMCSRLIDWSTDVLLAYLKAVMTYRQSVHSRSVMQVDHAQEPASMTPAMDLVADAIVMPYYESFSKREKSISSQELDKAEQQLRINEVGRFCRKGLINHQPLTNSLVTL